MLYDKNGDKTQKLLRHFIMNNLKDIIPTTVIKDTELSFSLCTRYTDKKGVKQKRENFYYIDLSFLSDEIKKEIESE